MKHAKLMELFLYFTILVNSFLIYVSLTIIDFNKVIAAIMLILCLGVYYGAIYSLTSLNKLVKQEKKKEAEIKKIEERLRDQWNKMGERAC